MLFSTEKTTLLNALEVAVKAINNKNTNPLLECAIIEVNKGVVTLKCSDINTTIISTFSTMDYENGLVAVEGKLLLEYIKKIKNDKITLSTSESDNNTKLTIKSGKSVFDIVTQDAKNYVKLKLEGENTNISLVQSEFREGLKEVIYAVAQDDTRPILTGVLFETIDNELNLVALDGYRMSVKTIPVDSTKNISTVIPGKAVNDIFKLLENNEENFTVKLYENFAEFKIKDTLIITRLLQGEFIKYNSILPDNHKYKIKANVAELLDSISRASIISGKDGKNLIKLKILNKQLIVTSNSQIGRTSDEVDLIESNVSEDFSIAFNAKYLMDLLSTLEEEVYLEFTTDITPVIIKKADDKTFTGLILPVRMVNN